MFFHFNLEALFFKVWPAVKQVPTCHSRLERAAAARKKQETEQRYSVNVTFSCLFLFFFFFSDFRMKQMTFS